MTIITFVDVVRALFRSFGPKQVIIGGIVMRSLLAKKSGGHVHADTLSTSNRHEVAAMMNLTIKVVFLTWER